MTSPTLIFDHATQELTYHTVKDYLQSSPLFQCSLQIEPHRPQFHVIYGSAQVDIEVTNWGFHPWNTDQDMAIVTASSCITRGSIFNTDLAQYLLIIILPIFCTELQSCILAVVTIADHYDDALVEGYGGKRAIDA